MSEYAGTQKSLAFLLLSALAMACFADYLFYGKDLGVSYPLFFIAMYALLLWEAKRRGTLVPFPRNREAWLLTLPVLLLACTFFLFSNPLFHALNLFVVPFLFVAQSLLLADSQRKKWDSFGFLEEMLRFVFVHTLPNMRLPFRYAKGWVKGRMDRRGIALKILTGIGLSLPILLVVIPLLAKADSVFAHFFNELPRMVYSWHFIFTAFRMFWILFVALVVFAYFYSLWSRSEDREAAPIPKAEGEKVVWDGIVLVTVLLVVNLVYMSFTYIQISYLFSGARAVLPAGMTYAEYARSGFAELVWVTLINFAILFSAMLYGSREKQGLYRTVQMLLSLLTVCTGFLLFSAYYRLSLYETAYGYTYTRFLAHAFMIVLFILLLLALLKVWREGLSLAKSYLVIGLAAYIAVQYVNMDALIAQNNIARYYETGKLDVQYLAELSWDAVPAIMPLTRDTQHGEWLTSMLQEKRDELRKQQPWQSFNLSRYVASTYFYP